MTRVHAHSDIKCCDFETEQNNWQQYTFWTVKQVFCHSAINWIFIRKKNTDFIYIRQNKWWRLMLFLIALIFVVVLKRMYSFCTIFSVVYVMIVCNSWCMRLCVFVWCCESCFFCFHITFFFYICFVIWFQQKEKSLPLYLKSSLQL